jgi:PTS system cellobiose-specific IIA component
MDMEEVAMMLIMNSGSARSFAMEAITAAKQNDFEQAEGLLAESEGSLAAAHKTQTELIQSEARGEKAELSVLLIHAQDHLMTSILAKDMAKEIVHLHKKLAE